MFWGSSYQHTTFVGACSVSCDSAHTFSATLAATSTEVSYPFSRTVLAFPLCWSTQERLEPTWLHMQGRPHNQTSLVSY